jgi:SAM-dependent methyltransferase
MTQHLFEEYYYSKPGRTGGTKPVYDISTSNIRYGSEISRLGRDPVIQPPKTIARVGPVTGVDIDPRFGTTMLALELSSSTACVYPFADDVFDACVSNWVLQHSADTSTRLKKVARVLRPGGAYCFRTPNLFHYVMLGSRLKPHFLHLRFSNRLRKLDPGAHDSYPTYYRANTKNRLKSLAQEAWLELSLLRLIEPEPSYGCLHTALFYPMVMYERLVNSTNLLSNFRVIIFGVCTKPQN